MTTGCKRSRANPAKRVDTTGLVIRDATHVSRSLICDCNAFVRPRVSALFVKKSANALDALPEPDARCAGCQHAYSWHREYTELELLEIRRNADRNVTLLWHGNVGDTAAVDTDDIGDDMIFTSPLSVEMRLNNRHDKSMKAGDGKRAWFSVVGARHIWAWNPLSASSSPTKSPYNHHPEMNGTWRKVCALKHDNVDIDGHGEGNESTNHRVVSRWKQGRYLLIASTCGRLPLNAAANDSSSVLSSISIFDAVAEQVLPCVFDDTRAAASPSNITALAWCPRSLLFFAGDSDGTFLVYGAWMLKETAARGIGSNEKVAHRWLRVGRSKDVRWYRRSSLAIVRESSARRAITCMQFNDDGTMVAVGYADGTLIIHSVRLVRSKHAIAHNYVDDVAISEIWRSSVDFGAILALSWATRDNYLVAGGESGAMTLFHDGKFTEWNDSAGLSEANIVKQPTSGIVADSSSENTNAAKGAPNNTDDKENATLHAISATLLTTHERTRCTVAPPGSIESAAEKHAPPHRKSRKVVAENVEPAAPICENQAETTAATTASKNHSTQSSLTSFFSAFKVTSAKSTGSVPVPAVAIRPLLFPYRFILPSFHRAPIASLSIIRRSDLPATDATNHMASKRPSSVAPLSSAVAVPRRGRQLISRVIISAGHDGLVHFWNMHSILEQCLVALKRMNGVPEIVTSCRAVHVLGGCDPIYSVKAAQGPIHSMSVDTTQEHMVVYSTTYGSVLTHRVAVLRIPQAYDACCLEEMS